nr:hypothetical protein [Tanacetum cinerariifolium]
MALTFADTHNMIAYLTKSDASEGFDQIIDFLNASSIKYTLTVNCNIYVSCIKQFWSSVLVKKVNDVMRLQALVDKKKVMITKATIQEALRLDGAESIDYLPNEEIFTELSRMGYEKPFTKLTIYKAFFSPQWKFLIHTILQCKRAKRTSWNVFSSSMASAIIFLSTGNGFSGVDTPLFEGMIVTQQVDEVADEGAADVDVDDDKIAQTLEITKLKQKVKKLERRNKLKVSKLRRLKRVGTAQRVDISKDTVMDDVLSMQDDELEPAELKEVVEVVTTAKLMIEVVTAASATITVVDTLITAATIITAPSAARRRKGVVEQDEAFARELKAELNNNINWDEVIEQVQRKEKEYNAVMRYQALKRKPQTEAQSRKNMMIYLRNMVGFKIDYFKGISYDEIHQIFEKYFNSNVAFLEKTKEQMEEEDIKALKRASESQAEKAAKKQKLDEEIAELKKHLQIVPNDEDDVYNEATPLARKNFDREDLEVLWQLVKERFASLKPKNFSDDFLLTTLTYMFEKPDVQAQVWKNQRSVHGLAKVKSWRLLESCGLHIITFTTTQMILLVERIYLLTRFTLDQMLNNVRLEVEEESEQYVRLQAEEIELEYSSRLSKIERGCDDEMQMWVKLILWKADMYLGWAIQMYFFKDVAFCLIIINNPVNRNVKKRSEMNRLDVPIDNNNGNPKNINVNLPEFSSMKNRDIHDLRSVETKFPAITFNDKVLSEKTLSCEPTISSLNDEIDFRVSFDDFDDEDYTVIFDKNSFSYKNSAKDLKTDSENDNNKVNMPSFLSPEPMVSYFDDLYYFKDFDKEFPAIVYNDALTSKLDFLTEPTSYPGLLAYAQTTPKLQRFKYVGLDPGTDTPYLP